MSFPLLLFNFLTIYIIDYHRDTLGQMAPRIFKETQKNPTVETAANGKITNSITTQLTAMSLIEFL